MIENGFLTNDSRTGGGGAKEMERDIKRLYTHMYWYPCRCACDMKKAVTGQSTSSWRKGLRCLIVIWR